MVHSCRFIYGGNLEISRFSAKKGFDKSEDHLMTVIAIWQN